MGVNLRGRSFLKLLDFTSEEFCRFVCSWKKHRKHRYRLPERTSVLR